MGLKDYRRKRDFTRTPEPEPSAEPSIRGNVFVVHKHAARNTHYDLRLRLGDALKCWAVPKGPSLDPAEKRLAVETEDHPLQYADFEGTIPEGQYGAGAMMIWDRGRWTPEMDAAKALKDGTLKFRLEGERLRGRWMLVRTKWEGKQPQWLLMKERDAEANPGVHAETFATSVASGRTMEEIAAGAEARGTAPPPAGPRSASLPGARAAPMPAKLKPQLAQPAEAPPVGDDWLHEVKFDGYRLLLFRRGDTVRIVSRTGVDWTAKLPALAAAVRDRLAVDAVLDGEAVVLDTRGVSDFQALQNAIHSRRAASIVFFAFDLPWCDGHDLTKSPLEQRRRLLAELIGTRQDGRLRFSEHVEGNGPAAFERVCAHGLEGVVSKKRDAPYVQARGPAWVKVKCFNQQEFVVGGFSAPEGTRQELGALLLGYHDRAGALRYAGKVGTGFSAETLRSLGALMRVRIRTSPPFVNPPKGVEARGVTWVRPDVVAQVQFREWTTDGVVRHTSFRGLRDDVDAESVVREPARPASEPQAATAKPPPPAPPKPPPQQRLSNPDRVVFPDRGAGYSITKRQVAEYYEAVAPLMLPHVGGRPLAILRCPDGEGRKAFFQKHPAKGMPAPVGGVDVPDDEGGPTTKHLLIRDRDGLMGLVQMNAIEFHPWGSRADDLEHPDRLIFDLDPGDDVPWKEIVSAAATVREALSQIKLAAYARTSGGNGLHVVVPLRPRHTWGEAKAFSKAFADTLARMAPRRFVATVAKEARRGRIYIDYLRNARGSTAVASYSLRARPGAPAAAPVGWDELADLPSADVFNARSVPRRVVSGVDPWAGMAGAAAALPRWMTKE